MLTKKDREFYQDWFLLKHTAGEGLATFFVLGSLLSEGFKALDESAMKYAIKMKGDKNKKVYFEKPTL